MSTSNLQHRTFIAALVLIATAIAASSAWVIASPVGSSPDEDFCVGSMWCPPPVDETDYQVFTKDGKKTVMVLQLLAKEYVTCYALDHNNSAPYALNASDEELASTLRWDDGSYPWDYYQLVHLFVQHPTSHTMLALRTVNTLLVIGLIGAIIALADPRLKRAISVAVTVAWLPMGLYFVADMNPSSWAMTGTFAFTAGLLATTRSVGPRRVGPIARAATGAIAACTSRGDSAFFFPVITIALAFVVPMGKRVVPEAAPACVASATGIWAMAHTNVAASHLGSSSEMTRYPLSYILWFNVSVLPTYLCGFAGHGLGPGWNDVSYRGTVFLGASLVVLAILCWSLRQLIWHKALSVITAFGAIMGVPIVIGLRSHFSNVHVYQPRYMLPLLAMLFLMLLVPSPIRVGDGRRVGSEVFRFPTSIAGRVGTDLMATLWAFVNARALCLVIGCYAFGCIQYGYPIDLPTRNLSVGNEWWWLAAPIGPMAVWILGSLAGALATGLAVSLRQRSPNKTPKPRR